MVMIQCCDIYQKTTVILVGWLFGSVWSLIASFVFYIYIYIYIYIHIYRYISKKKLYHEKGKYILSHISESETHILYRFITHRVTYFKPLFLEFFYDYGLQIMKTQNSVSQKMFILHKIN